MRFSIIITPAIALLACLALSLAACGDDNSEEEAYATFQLCFDDHHSGSEGLSIENSITVCVLEHPIAGMLLEFETAADCELFVAAHLDDEDASAAQITAGCADYIAQKD